MRPRSRRVQSSPTVVLFLRLQNSLDTPTIVVLLYTLRVVALKFGKGPKLTDPDPPMDTPRGPRKNLKLPNPSPNKYSFP